MPRHATPRPHTHSRKGFVPPPLTLFEDLPWRRADELFDGYFGGIFGGVKRLTPLVGDFPVDFDDVVNDGRAISLGTSGREGDENFKDSDFLTTEAFPPSMSALSIRCSSEDMATKFSAQRPDEVLLGTQHKPSQQNFAWWWNQYKLRAISPPAKVFFLMNEQIKINLLW